MSDSPPIPVVLRVQPSAIPALQKAFDGALADLTVHLTRLQHEGYLREAWLGDEMSIEVQDFYNRHVMLSTDGPFAALQAYRAELMKIRDTLGLMEEEYRRTEGDNAELWGRL